ncbi:hypothetical protein M011DRAFT_478483 [Sporormia fimetaria CBS 119925]|uniref:Exoribonuclease phosphorolytic domain-containing protein n=1 Tax=Sporormia fimetaria CBS 119925 TaxID=1340428 RepID=A0A6A6VAC3_9PLEO|nr:hypothetical protein M011DRAFT_478483 [Sporormia fimetaria CBS 119925]
MAPEVLLSPLHRADGSATYTQNGYSIIGAVNGPIEVLRKDELPSEATLEVHVRPAVGVGSPKERHLETLLTSTLRSIILTHHLPRTLIQLTLQVRSIPAEDAICGVSAYLTLLPHLINTSLLSLLSSSIPLRTTVTAALVVSPTSSPTMPLVMPTAQEILRAGRIKHAHVFAFDGERKMVVCESEGSFTFEEWEEAWEVAEDVCCRDGGVGLGEAMQVDGQSENLEGWLREVVRRKVEGEQRWKSGT